MMSIAPPPQHAEWRSKPPIPPKSAAFLFCTEATRIEAQGVMLARSIRERAGPYAISQIYAICPRPSKRPSPATIAKLKDLGVTVVLENLNIPESTYLSVNRLAVSAWAEANVPEDYLVALDSGMAFLDAPQLKAADAGVRPVDVKASATLGPGDLIHEFWKRMAALGGITVENMPYVETNTDGRCVRASYSGGFTVTRRTEGIFREAYRLMHEAVALGYRPLAGTNADTAGSTGPAGSPGSEYWGSIQAATSVAIWQKPRSVVLYPASYNVPVHILAEPKGELATTKRFNSPVLIHYRWMLEEQYRERLFDTLERLLASPEAIVWMRRASRDYDGIGLAA